MPTTSRDGPERAIDPNPVDDRVLENEVPGEPTGWSERGLLLRGGIVVGVACALAAGWRWGPLADWLRPETLVAWAQPFRDGVSGPWIVLAGYVIGGLVVFPVTVLILATMLLYGPVKGLALAMSGSLLSALVTYGIGRALGRKTVRSLGGSRLGRLSRRLRDGGFLPVAAVRLIPVGPFSLVSLIAGAGRIPVRAYLVGTAVGMAPGMIALAVFGAQIVTAVREPGAASFTALIAIGAALLAAALWLRRKASETEEPGG